MQLRKTLVPVLVVALVMGFAGTAAAQVTCQVASTPVRRGTATGLTEPVGDISFQCTSGGAAATDTATLSVEFGLPITNDTTHPLTGITLTVTVGDLFDVVGAGAITIDTIDNADVTSSSNCPKSLPLLARTKRVRSCSPECSSRWSAPGTTWTQTCP